MKSEASVKYKELLDYLQIYESAKVTQMARDLYLSEATVRRVLASLETEGKVRRFHGGAALANAEERSFVRRRRVSHLREKDAIGREAASLVREGMTLLLMGGTTVHAICPYIRGKRLTVITTSLPVMTDLAWEEQMQIILLGGVLNPAEMEVRGGLTQLSLGHLRADIMFTGTTGLHPVHGIMTDDPNGVEAYTTCMRISDQVFVLADHTKCAQYWGTTVLCALPDIDGLLLDSGTPEEERVYYQENVKRVIIADCEEGKQ